MMGTWAESEQLRHRFNQAAWVVVVVLLIAQFFSVISHSVNMPFWDEWDVLRPGALDRELNWKWLISFHNTHRNVPTYLSIWVLYRLGGWNLNAQAALNFIVYSLLVVGSLRYLERTFRVGLGPLGLFPASAISDEAHIHPFNGCWTFFILFFFLAVALAYRRDRWSWFAPAAAVVCAYSMFCGWVCAAVFVLISLVFAALRPELRLRHLAHAGITAVLLGVWWIGYPGQVEPLVMPWQQIYWIHLGNQLGLGMGYHNFNAIPGLALFFPTVVLMILAAVRALRGDTRSREEALVLLGLLAGFLAVMGSISVGRGWAGASGGKSGRYAMSVLFLIPLAWILFRLQLRHMSRSQAVELGVVLAVGLVLFAPLKNEFQYQSVYARHQAWRVMGIRCLRNHFYGNGGAFCPNINPYDPGLALVFEQRARELKLSYLREMAPFPL